VRLTVVPDEGEAEILCRLLRAEGILCAHVRTNSGSGGADASASFGGWREIIVAENDLEQARELLPAVENDPACVECGRLIGDNGRWYSDGVGDLVPYCPECAGREFGAGK
jgi:hypothetical protein